jgi:hypothetical protein
MLQLLMKKKLKFWNYNLCENKEVLEEINDFLHKRLRLGLGKSETD